MERDGARDQPDGPSEGDLGASASAGSEPTASDGPDESVPLLGEGDLDEDDDLSTASPSLPLPPEDRLWRHPSELKFTSPAAHATDHSPDPWLEHMWQSETVVDRPARTVVYSAALLSGIVAAALTAGLFLWIGPARERVVERTVERQVVPDGELDTVRASFSAVPQDVADVADEVKPTIVKLDVFGTSGERIGAGSGVIFRTDGHILTNAHVVAGAERIEVVLANGTRLDADVVGTDALTDVGIVAIRSTDIEPLPVAVLGDTTTLRVGERAIAIGSPLGLAGGPTVTVGVISAIGRVIQTPDGERLYDLVQTDAPIMPGSSGGALLDPDGHVIGITTVIGVSEVGAEGVGFAVPIEIAHDVALDLLTTGEARHGFLGVAGDDLATEQADELGVEGAAVITLVADGYPAADAGLRVGDVVTSLAGMEITSMADLIVTVRRLEPDTNVMMTVLRGAQEREFEIPIVQRPG